jgi:hypothetical protein
MVLSFSGFGHHGARGFELVGSPPLPLASIEIRYPFRIAQFYAASVVGNFARSHQEQSVSHRVRPHSGLLKARSIWPTSLLVKIFLAFLLERF